MYTIKNVTTIQQNFSIQINHETNKELDWRQLIYRAQNQGFFIIILSFILIFLIFRREKIKKGKHNWKMF